jgi:hypothetical protein
MGAMGSGQYKCGITAFVEYLVQTAAKLIDGTASTTGETRGVRINASPRI